MNGSNGFQQNKNKNNFDSSFAIHLNEACTHSNDDDDKKDILHKNDILFIFTELRPRKPVTGKFSFTKHDFIFMSGCKNLQPLLHQFALVGPEHTLK